ncbi:hypothetical protein AB0E59_12645 [Lentzea sp. NPDC034063]|uniref:hypothetical protein n=1 Tax=unclassified Lentzea TaxID=2643253 RepID=UPI0033EC2857
MRLLECGHAAVAGSSRVCEHLLVEEPPDFYRVLTGSGMRYDLACVECVEKPLLTACEGCVERAVDESGTVGWKGTPEVRHEDRPVAGTRGSEPCDVQPLNDRCLVLVEGGWLAVTAHGLAGSGGGRWDVPLLLPGTGRPSPALHASADGRYAAVVHDRGRKAVVLDTRSGDVVLRLDRGTYHVEQTPYPLAFLPGDRVVAATAWNRLDVFALPSGELLTEREPDLDYFQGRLVPSPSGRWLVADGWVWHPVGIPRVFDVDAWLRDGGDPPYQDLADRYYAWNQPITWVTPHVVAVQRIGEDDEEMIDGVELYAVPSGRRMEPFAGPVGTMWGHEGLLYVAGADGLEVWDPDRGARIGLVPGFRPTAHRDGTFVSLNDGVLDSFSVD